MRDRDRDLGEDEERPGSSGTNGRAAPDREAARDRQNSPRKKRGSGAAGSAAKRKRKEPDDVDSGYPPPPKRTRNPRGVPGASTPPVASPLASAAVVAADPEAKADAGLTPSPTQTLKDAPAEEMQVEAQPDVAVEPKRSARPRRARAGANKRRGSSASETNSSVSVSALANGTARRTRSRKTESRGQDVAAEKKEEEEPEEDAAVGSAHGNDGEQADGERTPNIPPAETGDVRKSPSGDTVMAETKPSPAKEQPPQKEEKEEGELSDEAEAPQPTSSV